MNELEFETTLRSLADQMDYPRTPDIAGHVRARLQDFRVDGKPRLFSRQVAWSLTISLILISSLLLIPPVRAAVIEFFQVGIVRIFPPDATPTAQPNSPAIPTATPGTPLPSLLPLLESISGATDLESAQRMVDYPILLPSYPSELGQPDRVYVQEAEGAFTVLVWMDPGQPERVLMSLHFIPEDSWAIKKMGPRFIREATVNGQYAIWAEGTYPIILHSTGSPEHVRLVDGHVLIWEKAGITYRLESDLSMEDAIRVAESLAPIP